MLRIAIFLPVAFLLAVPANAAREDPPEPGVAYELVEPSVGDVEVKAQPSASAATLAAFDEAVADVTVTGRVSVGAGRVWWEIVHPALEGQAGWVFSRFVKPVERRAEPATDYRLMCTGAEPGWALTVDGGESAFTSADGADETWSAVEWQPASGHTGRYVVALSPADGAPGYLVLNRSTSGCVAESGVRTPFDGTLISPAGGVLAGCCHRGG